METRAGARVTVISGNGGQPYKMGSTDTRGHFAPVLIRVVPGTFDRPDTKFSPHPAAAPLRVYKAETLIPVLAWKWSYSESRSASPSGQASVATEINQDNTPRTVISCGAWTPSRVTLPTISGQQKWGWHRYTHLS